MLGRTPSEQDLQALSGLGTLSSNPSFSKLESLKSLQWNTIDTAAALAPAGRDTAAFDPHARRMPHVQPREQPRPTKRSRRGAMPSAKRAAAERDAAAAAAMEQCSSSQLALMSKHKMSHVAAGPQQDQTGSSDITLQVCMRLLQNQDGSLQERPAHISKEVDPYLLFMETPKQKRTAGKWEGTAARIDRWANSGGVSGAHDYFPSTDAGFGALGVRKRYGRIVRQGKPLLKFFEFTLIHKGLGDDSTNTEDKNCVLFQVFSETSRAAPGKRHWETAEARESARPSAAATAADSVAQLVEDYPITSDEDWDWREKELQRLKELYECGLLTDDVYEEEQRRALHVHHTRSKCRAALTQDKHSAGGEGYGRLESAGALLDAIGEHSQDARATVASVIAPLDALLKASTMILGVQGASIITAAYEETSTSDEMWWKTALQWWCIGETAKNTQGRSAATAVWRKCLKAFDRMSRNAPPDVQRIYDFVELYCVQAVLLSMDDPADIDRYRPRLEHLSQTEQGQQPESAGAIAGLILTLDVMPALMDAGDIPRANAGLMRMMKVYFSVACSENISDEAVKLKHLRSAVWTGTAFKDILVLSPEFTWALFGEQGELITQAIETAHAEAPTTRALTASGSSYTESVYASFPASAPLALVWIEMDTANRCVDMQLAMLRTNIANIDNDRSESLTLLHAGYMWPTILHIVGRDEDATQLLRNLKMGWDTTNDTVDRLAANVGYKVFRKRGVSTGRHVNDVSYYSIMIRMSYALCSWPEISPIVIMAAVPTPQQLLDWGDTGHRTLSGQLNYACPALIIAEVCEKCEQYVRALEFVDVALSRDFLRGDMRPSVHVRAHLIRGRVLCRLGADRRQEAAVSFETAASSANQYAYWLLELLALRDMKEHLIDNGGSMDAAKAAAARIGRVLARLRPEAQHSDALAALLGNGWSVEELLLCAGVPSSQDCVF